MIGYDIRISIGVSVEGIHLFHSELACSLILSSLLEELPRIHHSNFLAGTQLTSRLPRSTTIIFGLEKREAESLKSERDIYP